jgi:pseudaminic acid cytidylyltransferase
MIVAIIPARGQSKRIPQKNIKLFAGQPIISYSIDVAKNTKIFDEIIVSTDSDEIARISNSLGANIPFMRPAELADDHTPTALVIIHTLKWLKDRGKTVKFFCCIYPTAPFLNTKYLKKGFELLRKNNAVTAFSVTTFPFPIFRALKLTKTGYLEMFWPKYRDRRSQDLPEAYHDAGQFYWGNTEKFLRAKTLYTEKSVPIVLPRFLVHDIDTMEDWETAEKMFLALGLNRKPDPLL